MTDLQQELFPTDATTGEMTPQPMVREPMVDVSCTDPKTAEEKTRVILELLRYRHESPEWATFIELPTGTGANGGRRIDFFAFNLWPSKRVVHALMEAINEVANVEE